MKTALEIEKYLVEKMPKAWPIMDYLSQIACKLAYAIGDRDGFKEGFSIGYEQGFQTAQAAERGIISVNKKINEMENAPVPTTDTSTAGDVSPLDPDYLFNKIKKITNDYNKRILKPKP